METCGHKTCLGPVCTKGYNPPKLPPMGIAGVRYELMQKIRSAVDKTGGRIDSEKTYMLTAVWSAYPAVKVGEFMNEVYGLMWYCQEYKYTLSVYAGSGRSTLCRIALRRNKQ